MVLPGYVLTPSRIRDIERLICCLKYAKAVADLAEINSSRWEFRGLHPNVAKLGSISICPHMRSA